MDRYHLMNLMKKQALACAEANERVSVIPFKPRKINLALKEALAKEKRIDTFWFDYSERGPHVCCGAERAYYYDGDYDIDFLRIDYKFAKHLVRYFKKYLTGKNIIYKKTLDEEDKIIKERLILPLRITEEQTDFVIVITDSKYAEKGF